MEVTCSILVPMGATGNLNLLTPLCSYLIPLDNSGRCRVNDIVNLFPFTALDKDSSSSPTFHFRIKLPGSLLDMPLDYVWLDIPSADYSSNIVRNNEIDELLIKFLTAKGSKFAQLEMQVKLIGLPWDTLIEFDPDDNYKDYLEETMSLFPAEERSRAHNFEPSINSSSSSNIAHGKSLDKLFKSLVRTATHLRKDQKQSSQYSNQNEGISEHDQASTGAAVLNNLKSVQQGASTLWKAFKATAEKLQAVGTSGFEAEQNPSMSQESKVNLSELALLVMTTYQEQVHSSVIRKLWQVTFPSDAIPEGHSFESPQWKICGWQKTHPSHDLKASGILALQAMIYFAEAYGDLSLEMIQKQKANTKSNYPYAIVCVNLTLLLCELFSLRDYEFNSKVSSFWSMFEETNAFYEIFSLSLIHMDQIWNQRQAVRTQFGAIIGEVKALLARILSRQPINVQHFRIIGKEEGMILID